MKNLSLLIVLILCLQESVSSQSCLPEGIIFSNQAAINNFPANYPGCTEIEGDVTISGVNITNLNGLIGLTAIGGTLKITGNDALMNLNGLNNLENIGADFLLDTNNAISNLSALTSLLFVGGDMRIALDPALTNLNGLGNLTSIGGDFRLDHNENLQNLLGVNNLDSIHGNLVISYNFAMTTLAGLIHLKVIRGDLVLLSLFQLTTLQALSNLTTIGGDLTICENYALTSLSGLENIDPASIENLTLRSNHLLTDCDIVSVCGYLADPGGSINIYANGIGCNDTPEAATMCGLPPFCLPFGNYYLGQEEVESFQTDYPGCSDLMGDLNIYAEDLTPLTNIISVQGNMTINTEHLTSFTGLNNLSSIGGDLTLNFCISLNNMIGLDNLAYIGGSFKAENNDNLLNFVGLNGLNRITGNLSMQGNFKLSSFTGLDNLDYIGGFLRAYGNDELVNLSGLENVDSIGGSVLISANYSLNTLTGLEGLKSIGEDLTLSDNSSMTEISALSNLKSIGGDLSIKDDYALASLEGLDSVAENSIENLDIINNALLNDCDVHSICDYLGSPNGTITITGNSPGCSDQQEVWLECTAGVFENKHVQQPLVWPNPATDIIYILTEDGGKSKGLKVYNQVGQMILYLENITNPVDISKLSPGIYVVELKQDQGAVRRKLVVN